MNDNRTPSAMYVISPNNSGAPPSAIKSPEFHTSDEKIKIGIGELKMEKHISFGTTHAKPSPKSASQLNASNTKESAMSGSEESKMMQVKVANNVTATQDDQSESSYKDDFESSFNKSDGFSAYDASFASSKISNSKTFKM